MNPRLLRLALGFAAAASSVILTAGTSSSTDTHARDEVDVSASKEGGCPGECKKQQRTCDRDCFKTEKSCMATCGTCEPAKCTASQRKCLGACGLTGHTCFNDCSTKNRTCRAKC